MEGLVMFVGQQLYVCTLIGYIGGKYILYFTVETLLLCSTQVFLVLFFKITKHLSSKSY